MKTRQKILQLALSLFNQKGYSNVGVREIARALDISPGNLSYHFSKKEDILFELAKQHSQNNDNLYQQFFAGEATLENFLILMMNTLKSQYKHRGALLELSLLTNEIKTKDRLNYSSTLQKRQASLGKILELLILEGQIKADESDIDFLISFLKLFARFAMQEAFLLDNQREENQVINYYLTMLTKQMSLFATVKGKNSIKGFRKRIDQL